MAATRRTVFLAQRGTGTLSDLGSSAHAQSLRSVSVRNTQVLLPKRVTPAISETHCCSSEKKNTHTPMVLPLLLFILFMK